MNLRQRGNVPAPPGPQWLIGRLSEYRELTLRLAQRPRLLIVESDPLSGSSAVIAHALDDLGYHAALIDARGLALANLPGVLHGAAQHDPDTTPDGNGTRRNRHRAASRTSIVAIDHLDHLLTRASVGDGLAVLESLRDQADQLGAQLLLVGRTRGPLMTIHAGVAAHRIGGRSEVVAMRRPRPEQFVEDIATAGDWSALSAQAVAAVAEMVDGAPAYVWRIADRLRGSTRPLGEGAAAWQQLREDLTPALTAQFELLGSVHRAAPMTVCAIACAIGPYQLPLNAKTVYDTLGKLRDRGVVFAPATRRWAVADPAFASWLRDHSPAWMRPAPTRDSGGQVRPKTSRPTGIR